MRIKIRRNKARIEILILIEIRIGIRNRIRIGVIIRIRIYGCGQPTIPEFRLRTDRQTHTHTDKARHRVATQLKTFLIQSRISIDIFSYMDDSPDQGVIFFMTSSGYAFLTKNFL